MPGEQPGEHAGGQGVPVHRPEQVLPLILGQPFTTARGEQVRPMGCG